MKTRHILTAMVLPAFLAACTADEFVENNNVNLSGRAELAPIEFTVNGEADTRFIFDEAGSGNWKWESAKDAFSAFLVDQNWAVTNKLYTNYIYKSEDGAGYRTTSTMVEGIYWFYAPAAESKNTRDLLPFKLATSQSKDYYKSDDAKVFFTALYKLAKEDNPQGLKLDMMNYYSRAVFPLTNNTDEAVKVKQIVLKGTDFQVGGEISMEALKDYMYGFNENGELTPVVNLDKDETNDVTVKKFKENLQKADLAVAPEKGQIETSNALVLDLGEGVTIAKGATETFTMLVPRTDASVSCSMTIIADKGMIEIEATDKSNYAKNVQFKHNGIMPMFGLQSDKTFKSYSIEKDKFKDIKDAYYVSNYDDMIALINTVNGDIKAYNFGDWSVDAAMAAAIESSDAYVEFQQPIRISDEKKEISLTKVSFKEGVTVTKGTKVDFKKSRVEERQNVVEKAFVIEEGAEATLTAGDFSKAEIANNGTLKVAKEAKMGYSKKTDGGQEWIPATITSTGTLTLVNNSGAKIVLNAGDLNYTAVDGKTENAASYDMGNLAMVAENSMTSDLNITIGENVTLTDQNYSEQWVKTPSKVVDEDVTYVTNITNNGTLNLVKGIEVSGDLKNNKTISGDGNLHLHKSGTNAAGAEIKSSLNVDEYVVLNNNGRLSGTQVINNGTIVTGKGSKTVVTLGTGVVNNTAKANVTVESQADQDITYVFESAVDSEELDGLNTELYQINKFVFKGQVTVDKNLAKCKGVRAMEFMDGSGLFIDAEIAQGTLIEKVVINGDVTFSGWATNKSGLGFRNGAEFTIRKNSVLTINDLKVAALTGKTLTFAGEKGTGANDKQGKVVNNGIVLAGGAVTEGSVAWEGTSAENDAYDEN